ncbi:MAG: hypothetical protein Q4E62_07200, partial [Sutterellaceae bacterium]|nr:hypothetical protein [Sutterellaceae bacterium]
LSLGRGQKRHPTLGKGVVVGAGAKILGGFTVGDNARIGSNAVVVKPVEADTTVVGVPARATHETKKEKEHARDVFAAYGVMPGEDDPYLTKIQQLEEALAQQAKVIDKMQLALKKASDAHVKLMKEVAAQSQAQAPVVQKAPEVDEMDNVDAQELGASHEPLVQVETKPQSEPVKSEGALEVHDESMAKPAVEEKTEAQDEKKKS